VPKQVEEGILATGVEVVLRKNKPDSWDDCGNYVPVTLNRATQGLCLRALII
jgi:hypothetical protein